MFGDWAQGVHAYEEKFHIAMCRLRPPQRLMSMNSELLELDRGVFYLRSTTSEALQISMCPPPLGAHHPPQSVWQSNMNGLAIPTCIQFARWATLCSPSCVVSIPWVARAVAC